MNHSLRILAVAAPESAEGHPPDRKLYSRDPFSLFNALRVAADQSRYPDTIWGKSNFAGTRRQRRDKFLLMYSLEDMPLYEKKLREENPDVVFIGAMTPAFPGAIACAKKTREILGDQILIVLGGRHASETIFRSQNNKSQVLHHTGSPLRLMAEGKIPHLFDLVVSGQGEQVVADIGNLALQATMQGNMRDGPFYLENLSKTAGNWIVGCVRESEIITQTSPGISVDYNELSPVASLFGVTASFPVFEGLPTAHAYSDTGPGCIYSCSFCSEARSVTGKGIDPQGAPRRLHKQLKAAAETIHEDHGASASAYVEDSIFLQGNPRLIRDFVVIAKEDPLEDIVFGGQFTIDIVLKYPELIRELYEVGLRYVFFGVETYNPDNIQIKMPKNIIKNGPSWAERTKQAVSFCTQIGIKTGASLLFGLGEPQSDRIRLLRMIEDVQKTSSIALRPVSANWAVLYPRQGLDQQKEHDYLNWGTDPQSPYFKWFQKFGDASERYPIKKEYLPTICELEELCVKLDGLNDGPVANFAMRRKGSIGLFEKKELCHFSK